MPNIVNVPGVANLSLTQRGALVNAAAQLKIPVDWLATVISFESAGSFSPTKRNAAGSGAFGLIQFMPNTAQRLLGTKTKEEAVDRGMRMSFEEQLQKMVVPYLSAWSYQSLNDVYLAIFYPAAMHQPDSWVVGKAPSKVYTQNAGFDKEGKGYITRADITRTINRVYNNATGTVPAGLPASSGGQVLTGLIFSALVFGSYYEWQRPNSRIRSLGRQVVSAVDTSLQPAWLQRALKA